MKLFQSSRCRRSWFFVANLSFLLDPFLQFAFKCVVITILRHHDPRGGLGRVLPRHDLIDKKLARLAGRLRSGALGAIIAATGNLPRKLVISRVGHR